MRIPFIYYYEDAVKTIIGCEESHWKVYVYFHWSSVEHLESHYMYVLFALFF